MKGKQYNWNREEVQLNGFKLKENMRLGLTAEALTNALVKFAKAMPTASTALRNLGNSLENYERPYRVRAEQRKKIKRRFNIAIVMLFSMFVQAQSQNIDYLKTLNKCDENFARQFSDLVANNCKTKYQFYGIVKSVKRSTYTIVYIPENSTEVEKQNIKEFESTKEYQDFEYPNCLSVHFYTFNDGENIDFQIKGVEKLKFHSVKSKYLNIFPTWKTLFDPTADVENTLKVFSPKYENIQNKLKFYLKKNNDLWEINNWSN